MRTTLNINDGLLAKALELTGVWGKTALVRLGLKALIAQESEKRLAKLGGTEKELRNIPKRRFALMSSVLVDTSLQVSHLRSSSQQLATTQLYALLS
jgi:Arc/MetJ family transcription regulator